MVEVSVEPRWLIFCLPDCNYCEQAKALLGMNGVIYTEADASQEIDFGVCAEMMGSVNPATFPQIFHDGNHIGGYVELKALIDNGEINNYEHSKPVETVDE